MKLLFLFLCFCYGCNSPETSYSTKILTNKSSVETKDMIKKSSEDKVIAIIPEKNPLSADTSVLLSYLETEVPVNIKVTSKDFKGSILLLHGWNLPATEWCEKTELCTRALANGYNVILPDFGKSTYQWELYPETINRYKPYANRSWMYEVFLSHLQIELKLLLEHQFNAVIGLSTGGRGAALFALEHPNIFNACVALSADFDQTKIPNEPINTGFYGSYTLFPERWSGKDNIYNRASEFRVPLYLGHGGKDSMCPTEQTQLFYEKLKTLNKVNVSLSIKPLHGHDYDYWGEETEAIMEFIDRLEK